MVPPTDHGIVSSFYPSLPGSSRHHSPSSDSLAVVCPTWRSARLQVDTLHARLALLLCFRQSWSMNQHECQVPFVALQPPKLTDSRSISQSHPPKKTGEKRERNETHHPVASPLQQPALTRRGPYLKYS